MTRVNFITALLGAAVFIVAAATAGIVVIYTGAYNVAATEEHASVTRWALDTTMRNSVEQRAENFEPPEVIAQSMVAAGGRAYKAMCQHCHSGPGAERAEWASGLRPRPPQLVEAASNWKVNEIFWLAKHGVRATGMPAFGPTHSDAELWGIAAFVKHCPA